MAEPVSTIGASAPTEPPKPMVMADAITDDQQLCGLRCERFEDMAYQYSQTDGDFYPFMSYVANSASSPDNCIADGVKVSNKRNQMLLTLGYRF